MTGWSTLKKLIWLRIIKGGGSALRTVTGAIVHVTNALALPAEALTVNVEPIQDLHGYDSPWPAGGGKNKFPALSGTSNGITYTLNQNGTVNVNGTSTAYSVVVSDYVLFPAGSYKLTGTSGEVSLQVQNRNGTTLAQSNSQYPVASLNLSEDTEIRFRISVPGASITVSNVTVSPMLQDASITDPTFAPYSNICPISGRTSATVTRTGKNLLPPQNIVGSMSDVIVSSDGDIVTLDGTASAYGQAISDSTFILPKGTYRLKAFVVSGSASGSGAQYQLRSPNGHTVYVQTTIGSSGVAFTLSETTEVKARVTYLSQVFSDYNVRSLLVVGSSEPSDFVPYVGTTYTIALGDTVYGGTLDAVNGTMTITQVKAQHSFALPTRQENGRWILGFYPKNILSTLFGKQWAVSEPPLKNLFRASNLPIIKEGNLTSADSASVSFYGHNAGVEIRPRFLASQFSAEEAQTIASAMEFVYPINPIEITLTPTQIDMLLGTNNLWADAGDLTLTYYADGNASTSEALGILLGGTYNNPGGADDVSDDEALGILLGGS